MSVYHHHRCSSPTSKSVWSTAHTHLLVYGSDCGCFDCDLILPVNEWWGDGWRESIKTMISNLYELPLHSSSPKLENLQSCFFLQLEALFWIEEGKGNCIDPSGSKFWQHTAHSPIYMHTLHTTSYISSLFVISVICHHLHHPPHHRFDSHHHHHLSHFDLCFLWNSNHPHPHSH